MADAPAVWIDTEDLFTYAAHNPRLSGIQRVAFEIYPLLSRQPGAEGRIRFVRHHPYRDTFTVIPWSSLQDLLDKLTGDAPRVRPAHQGLGSGSPRAARLRAVLRPMSSRLPPAIRQRLRLFLSLQLQALRAAVGVVAVLLGRRGGPNGSSETGLVSDPAPVPAGEDFQDLAKPGDYIAVLGSPWDHPDYGRLVRAVRDRHGTRFAFLVYDLIPIVRPEWCDRGLVRSFSAWYDAMLPVADAIFAISKATRKDIEAYARKAFIPLRGPVQVIPMGTVQPPLSDGCARIDDVVPDEPFVLYVSTIEARKNHVLLFRVWRQLLDSMPPGEVPLLVFAGRVGWLVSDLITQLENSEYLNGRIRIIPDLGDAALRALYRGCLFTVFASWYEGWGLPVSESLAFGVPCIASNTTSIPEAGGEFARYFDPGQLTEVCQVIRAAIEDPEGLRAWREEISRSFVSEPWSSAARVIVEGLGLGGPANEIRDPAMLDAPPSCDF